MLGVILFLSSATRICSLQEVVISCPHRRDDPDIVVDLDIKSILMRIVRVFTMSDFDQIIRYSELDPLERHIASIFEDGIFIF